MLHPSRCCAKGIHVRTEIAPGVKRCIWCGALTLVSTPTPQHVEPATTPTTSTTTEESGAKFRECARAYAERSPLLAQWQHAGNKLPEVYR